MIETLHQFSLSLTAEVLSFKLFSKDRQKNHLPEQKSRSQLDQEFNCYPTHQKSPELELFSGP